MMDCSSKLALRTGNQLKSAGKAEQDRQERPQLRPVQQQAYRFKAQSSSPPCLGARETAALSVAAPDLATQSKVNTPRSRRSHCKQSDVDRAAQLTRHLASAPCLPMTVSPMPPVPNQLDRC